MTYGNSERKVISEAEILAVACPICNAAKGFACRFIHTRIPLSREIEETELVFHHERIKLAQDAQILRNFGRILGPTEKALITYYAFIMLADSVSLKSVETLGRSYTSVEIQKFFAQQAIKELRKDKLL